MGFRPTDPHYPCDVVEAAARPSCYLYQPIAILYLNGHDVAATFASCDRAAASDVPSCYFGIGGAISGMTHQDIARSDQLCRLGAPRYQAWCFENLAAILVDTSLSTAGAVAQCAAAPRWFGPHCVEVVADRVGSNWSDPNDRARECGRFPGPTASEQCRRLAAVA